jgi:hypothetical protein
MQTNLKTQRLLLNISLRLLNINKTEATDKILREYRKKKIYIEKQ